MDEVWRRSWRGWRERFHDDFLFQAKLPGAHAPVVKLRLKQAPAGALRDNCGRSCRDCVRRRQHRCSIDNSRASAEHEVQRCDPWRTGTTLWDAGLVLAHWLLREPQLVHGKRCLELGAGVGLVSCVVCLLQPETVVATDLEAVVPLLANNLAAASRAARELTGDAAHSPTCGREGAVVPLQWGCPKDAQRVLAEHGPFDVILGADLVYNSEAVEPLAATLCALTERAAADSGPLILFAQDTHIPEAVGAFYSNIRNYFLAEPVEPTRLDASVSSEAIEVFIFRRRRSSSAVSAAVTSSFMT
ncbi:hypothetical protein CDCA_CDCA01G0232 [Cyanidium caldarium]|uniref:Uncharacterized protein n=1 Tax=Cyanidium caldarium TaxID=2771 RepID=A0AAV9IPC8_CYACA|nr:hypothetical protein CDCA_CDCA01G0232 [Cyanidium caldarium]